jgi:AraC-like DNA-binding protein
LLSDSLDDRVVPPEIGYGNVVKIDGNKLTIAFEKAAKHHRPARAHRCLVDPRSASHMIRTIAFEAGFGDLFYFNHVFRRRYGATPSDNRAAAPKDTTV